MDVSEKQKKSSLLTILILISTVFISSVAYGDAPSKWAEPEIEVAFVG